MGELVAFENVTLDGVMQSPGRPDEDTRDGFTAGGWAVPYQDAVAMEQAGKGMSSSAAILLGRRTYDDFHGYWPRQTDGNPFTTVLNEATKYVATRTLTSLPWQNSERVTVDDIAAIKSGLDKDLVLLGSGDLLRSVGHLVDRIVVSTYPLALGTGRRLPWPVGTFELVSSVPTGTGVIIATYARTTS